MDNHLPYVIRSVTDGEASQCNALRPTANINLANLTKLSIRHSWLQTLNAKIIKHTFTQANDSSSE